MALVPNLSWSRVLVEGGVIVVSILLAFWIDAWWDRQQEVERETVLLESLLRDLRQIQASRVGRDEFADEIMESARKLLDIARSPDDATPDRDIDFLLNDLTYVAGGFSQGSHILNMLFSGGELAVIQNNELRQSLVDLRFAFIEEAEGWRREMQFMEAEFYPYLDANTSLGQIWGADDGQPGVETGNYNESEFPVGREAIRHTEISHRPVLEDRQFQNILIRKIHTLTTVKGWEDDVYDADAGLAESIALIESILAN